MAFDAFALQHPMKPEAVETRFLNDDDRKGFSGPLQRLPLELRKARQQRSDIPARTECFDIFSPEAGDSDVISQMERLSSKETKLAAR